MTAQWRLAIVTAGALVLLADRADACSCMESGPPCQAAFAADVVFSGVVRSIERVETNLDGVLYTSLLVRFDAERGFLSAEAGRIDVTTALHGASCGYSFVVGKRYVVYAFKTASSGLTTGICSRTRPVEEAEEDLRYLASIPAKGSGARVYGRINEWRRDPAEEDWVDYGPLEGIRVSVHGGTWLRDVFTDAHGRFEVTGLPAGKATATAMPPFGFDARYLTHELDLRDRRACRALDFRLTLRARASGTVVDSSGRPVGGVTVDAVAAELAGFDPPPFQHPVKTNERGAFEFDSLPPGTYVFGINLTTRRGATRTGTPIFLPGVWRARDATPIELKAGDETSVGVLRLPSR